MPRILWEPSESCVITPGLYNCYICKIYILRVVNDQVFEGEEGHRVPQRNWDKSHLLKMAGIMICHSILHKGPHFPVIAPYVYHFIHSGDKELSAGYILRKDLPHTPATSSLVSLTNEVSFACRHAIII